jgi:hypothetical protein
MIDGQLQLDLDRACRRLADDLTRRHVPASGAERLLRALVRTGLDERALPAAAGLALELDRAGDREMS